MQARNTGVRRPGYEAMHLPGTSPGLRRSGLSQNLQAGTETVNAEMKQLHTHTQPCWAEWLSHKDVLDMFKKVMVLVYAKYSTGFYPTCNQ